MGLPGWLASRRGKPEARTQGTALDPPCGFSPSPGTFSNLRFKSQRLTLRLRGVKWFLRAEEWREAAETGLAQACVTPGPQERQDLRSHVTCPSPTQVSSGFPGRLGLYGPQEAPGHPPGWGAMLGERPGSEPWAFLPVPGGCAGRALAPAPATSCHQQ